MRNSAINWNLQAKVLDDVGFGAVAQQSAGDLAVFKDPQGGAAADAGLGILLLHSFFTGGDNTVPASGRAVDAETGMGACNLRFHTFGRPAHCIGG